MKTALTVDVQPGAAGATLVRLAGTLDEELGKAPALDGLAGVVVIDLDGVTRITSFGVREWMRLVARFPAGALFLTRLRPGIVSQLNMVAGFAGAGQIVSTYLPYVCSACEHEHDALLDLRTSHDVIHLDDAPSRPCPACGAAAELDEAPSGYFAFLRRHPSPVLPAAVEELIEGRRAQPARPGLEVKVDVVDGLTAVWLSGTLDGQARFRGLESLEGEVVVIVADLIEVTPDGASRFLALRQEPRAWWLARARPAVAKGLVTAQPGALRVVSLSTRCRCLCGGAKAEVDVDTLADGHGLCVRCGERAPLDLTAAQSAALARTLRAASPTVATYLSEHPLLPTQGEGPAQPASRYPVVRRIGTGGMAEVFLAERRGPGGFGKKLVIKRILPQLAANPEFRSLFLREAQIAALINHPNVVQIFDLGEDDGRLFIAMEWVRGRDLASLLKQARGEHQPMPVNVACRIVADVCAGLHAAHVARDDADRPLRIIHRDVTPHNVLVSHEGSVKLSDFGISKAASSASLTKTGFVRGKTNYTAPEQLDPSTFGTMGPQSDVWAAGVVLYECLTGIMPFARADEHKTMAAVLSGQVPAIEPHRRDVPPEVVAIINKALQRSLTQRFVSASEMQHALERTLLRGASPTTATTVSAWANGLGVVESGFDNGSTAVDVISLDVADLADVMTLDIADLVEDNLDTVVGTLPGVDFTSPPTRSSK